MSPLNGKTKIAVISVICTVILCAGSVGGWVVGWRTKVKAEGIRDQAIDDLVAAKLPARVALNEELSKDNKTSIDALTVEIGRLVAASERTNQQLDRLSGQMMEYLAAQAKKQGVR